MTRLLISLIPMIVAVLLQLFLLYRSYTYTDQANKTNRKLLILGLVISIACIFIAVYYTELFPLD